MYHWDFFDCAFVPGQKEGTANTETVPSGLSGTISATGSLSAYVEDGKIVGYSTCMAGALGHLLLRIDSGEKEGRCSLGEWWFEPKE